ncbi:MAG: glycoside hydrolase [Candidatus Melainabacteria bacterium]|nr:MAG: glycoside hydrolase [Candidatus Melainabacteria bacterium]
MDKEVYLTIHGHFYQPPRENPWLEYVEMQDSALPFHDWNERVDKECYTPNSVSKIVDNRNLILDVVNNYSYINFNFGPTLLSWMEKYSPLTYERIIKADKKSIENHEGHGNAIAQVYNHIIMPLANERDKNTQVKWGIRDFEKRFGRKPEGMWLAETAADDDTLRVLVENGIKYTILSPYQALRVRPLNSNDWTDVSWGNIDPARPYRYYIKSQPDKFIDIFFYDGAISKSVAFDEILKDGNRFIKRLKEGISDSRNYPQIVNIATDGESYGHHTKFGDMALAYIMKVMAKDEGFTVVNYAQYLAKYPSEVEADIKQGSSWSCFHGVGRWKEDCGCSTGGHPNWNQKWRKPLRDALDYLRDELICIYEKEAKNYMNSVWDCRDKYIDVILDRRCTEKFQEENFIKDLTQNQKVKAMKLLEMQRQAMLMYTSCGWFFSEISGIETVQIMKYAARAIQLAKEFTSKDIETGFLKILNEAKSNIVEYGTGKDIYNRFVLPSVITSNQIAALWTISSLYRELEDCEEFYCYKITKKAYKNILKSKFKLIVGRIEVQSEITLEKNELMVALLQYSGGDFHCAIKPFESDEEYERIQRKLYTIYLTSSLTEIIRAIDEDFGKEYFTVKDIFLEERRKLLETMLKGKIQKFEQSYQDMYFDSRASVYYMQSLGLKVPDEFKILAKYTLSKQFNELVSNADIKLTDNELQQATDINTEAEKIGIEIDKDIANRIYGKKIAKSILYLTQIFNCEQAEEVLDVLNDLEKLDLKVEITEAQNIYFLKVFKKLGSFIQNINKSSSIKEKEFISLVLKIGKRLNIDTDFYEEKYKAALSS